MTDTKEISEAINVQELFEKSKIGFSKEYIKNLSNLIIDYVKCDICLSKVHIKRILFFTLSI